MLEKQLKEFWKYLSKAEYICLCTHVEPDGDTLGSAVALKELIQENLDNVKEVRISGDDYPRNLSFLINKPGLVSDEFFNKSLKVVVDTSTKSRIYDKRVIPNQSIKIDHHPHEEKWVYEIGGDNWPATGQLIAFLVKYLDLKTTPLALEAIAVAILTDTEFFKERNISAETFEAMKILFKRNLNYGHLLKKMALNTQENTQIFNTCAQKQVSGIVSWTISKEIITNDLARPLVAKFVETTSTEVSIAFLKRNVGDYRAEIRSKDYFDVSKIATHFGGGGHHNSSGFIIKNKDQIQDVINYINSQN